MAASLAQFGATVGTTIGAATVCRSRRETPSLQKGRSRHLLHEEEQCQQLQRRLTHGALVKDKIIVDLTKHRKGAERLGRAFM